MTPLFIRKMLLAGLSGTCQVALFTNQGGTEVSGTGYTRQATTFSVTSTVPAYAQYGAPAFARNDSDLNFGPATSPWGTITHIGVYDADGLLCLKKELTYPQEMTPWLPFTIPAGSIEVGLVQA